MKCWIENIRANLPALPEARIGHYVNELQLSLYDARQLTDEKEIAEYFEAVIKHTSNYKAAANWLLGPVRSYLNENNISINDLRLRPATVAELIALVDEGRINFSMAASRVLPVLIANHGRSPVQVIQELNLAQTTDADAVQAWVDAVIQNMPDKVSEYRKGKKGLIGLFVGEVKKLSKGKADPKLVNDMLNEKLNK